MTTSSHDLALTLSKKVGKKFAMNSLLNRCLLIVVMLLMLGCKEKRDINSHTQLWAYKLSDDLHLAMVPLERSLEPLDKDALRAKFPEPKLPPHGQLRERFVFYVPGATAPENPRLFYSDNMNDSMGQPRDLNIVVVRLIEPWTAEVYSKLGEAQIEAQQDARIGWADNSRTERNLTIFQKHGMQCYVEGNLIHAYKPLQWDYGYCIAERAPGEFAHFDFDDGLSGHIRAEYYSPKYGGLSVIWETTNRNFSRWREIDARLWQIIDERNLAKKP
jgi:hypothetical protein